VSRTAQKFLTAEKLYRSNIPSGETEEETTENFILCYRKTSKYKVRNEMRTPGPISFIKAVRVLERSPTFSSAIGGYSKKAHGYRNPVK